MIKKGKQMGELEKIFQILQEYNQNDEVLGTIVIGSLGKGYQTEKSDIDLELIVTNQKQQLKMASTERRLALQLLVL